MSYYMYLDGVLFPVTPSQIDMKIKGQNKTMNLINNAQINVLKNPGLTEVSFKALLPAVKYPFAEYGGDFIEPKWYLKKLEELQTSKKPFQFVVTRNFPTTGKELFHTNLKVALESYEIKEDANQGFDVVVSVKLKQYREYGTKIPDVSLGSFKNVRYTARTVKTTQYTVAEGDSLWNISKSQYGDGAKYTEIQEANKDVIGNNPNSISPGQVLTIPEESENTSSRSKWQNTPRTSNAPTDEKRYVSPVNVKINFNGLPAYMGYVRCKYTYEGKTFESSYFSSAKITVDRGSELLLAPSLPKTVKYWEIAYKNDEGQTRYLSYDQPTASVHPGNKYQSKIYADKVFEITWYPKSESVKALVNKK